MTRVTEFPEGEERSPREEPERQERPRGQKLSLPKRIGEFYHNVKLEMRKVAWPTRTEVWSTTIVVLIAVLFFGFYLWGVDLLVAQGLEALQSAFQ
jgi:preprotein translocase subunit SecE